MKVCCSFWYDFTGYGNVFEKVQIVDKTVERATAVWLRWVARNKPADYGEAPEFVKQVNDGYKDGIYGSDAVILGYELED